MNFKKLLANRGSGKAVVCVRFPWEGVAATLSNLFLQIAFAEISLALHRAGCASRPQTPARPGLVCGGSGEPSSAGRQVAGLDLFLEDAGHTALLTAAAPGMGLLC